MQDSGGVRCCDWGISSFSLGHLFPYPNHELVECPSDIIYCYIIILLFLLDTHSLIDAVGVSIAPPPSTHNWERGSSSFSWPPTSPSIFPEERVAPAIIVRPGMCLVWYCFLFCLAVLCELGGIVHLLVDAYLICFPYSTSLLSAFIPYLWFYRLIIYPL